MKKFAYIISIALLGLFAASCEVQEGTAPGSDGTPHVTIFQYTPSSEYNSDEDIKIRFVKNNQTTSAKFLVELTKDKAAAIETDGEKAYIEKVLSTGTDIDFTDEGIADTLFTGLANYYDITVVAVNGGKKEVFSSTFAGLAWKPGVVGTYYFSTNFSTIVGAASVTTEFQVCDSDSTLCRFKDIYGAGKSLKVKLTDDDPVDSGTTDGEYHYFRVENQATPFTYSSYGTVYIRDIGYALSDDYFYAVGSGYDCGIYGSGKCFLNVGYYVSAGRLTWGWDEVFIPNA